MKFDLVSLHFLFFTVVWGSVTPTRVLLEDRAEQVHPGIPACKTVATTPKPAKLRCERQGQLSSPSVRSGPRRIETLADCRGVCLDDSFCHSFSYEASSKTCTTYDKAIIRQGFSYSKTSGVYFWNRSCFKITCQCPSGQAICGSYCANLLKDRGNCGGCGNTCGEYETCSQGACVTTQCTNLVNCDAGVFGAQTFCSDNNKCGCFDVDGSQDSGLCSLAQAFCDELQVCDTSADCKKPGFFCTLRSCCDTGVCVPSLLSQCANPNYPQEVFQQKSSGTPNRKTVGGV